MKKTILIILLVILFVLAIEVEGGGYMEYISVGLGNTLWCSITNGCNYTGDVYAEDWKLQNGSSCCQGGASGVTAVTGTSPIVSSGGTTPDISWNPIDIGLGFRNLSDYPSACTTGQYVHTVGDTLTCSAPSYINNCSVLGSCATTIAYMNYNNEGNFTVDTNTLFVDSTNNRVGIGVSSGFDPRTGLSVSGDLDVNHTATENDDHAVEIDVDAAGFGDVKGIDIVYTTGAISAGEEEEVILINIDESSATGGDVIGMIILTTEGPAGIYGVECGAEVNCIVQLSGTFTNMDSANNSGTDNRAEFISSASDVSIFSNDNDYIIIGDEDKFEELEFLLNTTASNPGIKPTFEYSTGVGTWGTFSPADGTNGMRNTGVIAWFDDDIPTWAAGAGSEYLIRINRTQNNLNRVPIEDKVQIAAVTIYKWNKDGDLVIREINASDNIRIGGESVPIASSLNNFSMQDFNNSFKNWSQDKDGYALTTNIDSWISSNVSGKPDNGSDADFSRLSVGTDNNDKELTVVGDVIADTYWLNANDVFHLGTYTTLYNTNSQVFFMNIVTSIPFTFQGYSEINFTDANVKTEGDIIANSFNGSWNESDKYPLASSLNNFSMQDFNNSFKNWSQDKDDYFTKSEVFDNHSKEGYLKNGSSANFSEVSIGHQGTTNNKLSISTAEITPAYPAYVEISSNASNTLPDVSTALNVQSVQNAGDTTSSLMLGLGVFQQPSGTLSGSKIIYAQFGSASPTMDMGNLGGNILGLGYSAYLDNDWAPAGFPTVTLTTQGIQVDGYLGRGGKKWSGTKAKGVTYGANLRGVLGGNYTSTQTSTLYGTHIETADELQDSVTNGKIDSYTLYLKSLPITNLNGGESWAIYSESDVASYLEGNLSVKDLIDRTPAFEGTTDEALSQVLNIQSKDGEIDHSTLPDIARAIVKKVEKFNCENVTLPHPEGDKTEEICETRIIEEDGRSISGMTTILVEAVKELDQENQILKDRITIIENCISTSKDFKELQECIK